MDKSVDNWVQPEWWGPLSGWVGGVIPAEPILGRSDVAAVVMRHLSIYPNGIAFQLHAFKRPVADESLGSQSNEAGTSLSTDQLNFGVRFEDGRCAERLEPVGGPGSFTIKAFQEGVPVKPDPVTNIVLNFRSGGGGPSELSEDWFVWPLPPSGSLEFFCDWSAVGISGCRVEVAEDLWRGALERAYDLHLAR